MRVIGTAGHVDHGKSTLVKALTGIDPDRLKEEQDRQMTIDLGFAWMTLPSGQVVSLVDVPGHEAFIKNMLAGVGGIDAALLVVAADEGIMPQTREHLSILDLLRIKGGVIALTKIDLAGEVGWLEMVEGEIREAVKGTVLSRAPIIPVSARTREGLQSLKVALDNELVGVNAKSDLQRPRLPIDRVFTMPGFGTVVTGTLADGSFSLGDDVEIAPGGLRGRIRGIQSHKEKLARAGPGRRIALNLVGIETNELARGDTVLLPGSYLPTQVLDARIIWLPSAPKSLAHNDSLDLFVFSTEAPVRVRLLQGEELKPGEAGWAQIVLNRPVIVAKGDRFVLRYPSPSLTVGGGEVVDPHPAQRHRRGRAQLIARLERAILGTPTELIVQFVETHGPVQSQVLAKSLGMSEEATNAAVHQLLESASLLSLRDNRGEFLLTTSAWSQILSRINAVIEEYHRQFPLRSGIAREELKSRLNLTPRIFDPALEKAARDGVLLFNEKFAWLPEHSVRFDEALSAQVDSLLAKFEETPYSPPSIVDAEAAIGSEALNALIEQGRIVKIGEQVVMTPAAEQKMREWVVKEIRERGQVTAGELRDHFNTSRKYTIAFLEYLDQKRLTKRVGDARVLRQP